MNSVQPATSEPNNISEPPITLQQQSVSQNSQPTPSQLLFKKKTHIEEYLNMRRANPDWQFAYHHGQSTKPGVQTASSSHDECICCMRVISKSPLPLCQNSKQLQFLGYGFPLYFMFVKYALVILLLQIINYTGINLYRAITDNHQFCVLDIPRSKVDEKILCTSFMVFFSSIHQKNDAIENILRLSSFVTLLLSLLYVRDHLTKSWRYYDERETSFGDFSILLGNLPKKEEELQGESKTMGQRIREFFSDQKIFGQRPEIKQINLLGSSKEYWKLQRKIEQVVQQRQQYLQNLEELQKQLKQKSFYCKKEESIVADILEYKKKVSEVQERLSNLQQQSKKQKQRLNLQLQNENVDCDQAIVCFETQQEALKVLATFDNLKPQQLMQYFQKADIIVDRSPEPMEINWEFIIIPERVKYKRIIASWIIFFMVLAVLTVGFYFLEKEESDRVQQLDRKSADPIVYCTWIAIILFNKFILAEIIHHLVQFQLPRTGSVSQFSFTVKYALGLFFTTAVMTVIVEGFVQRNIYQKEYGIVQQQTLMFFFNSFFVPLIWIINPWYLFKLYQRSKYQKATFLTQAQANKLMEDPQYLMGKRYGEIIQMLWFTFLYMSLIPFGSMLIFFGLCIYYWVDKYNLLRRSSITQGVSGDLCLKALFLFEFALILKPGGQILFDKIVRHQWHVVSVVEISIGGIYLLLPVSKLLEYFYHEKFYPTSVNYQEYKAYSSESYELHNPISKEYELVKHFQRIQSFSQIDQGDLGQLRANNRALEQRRNSIKRPRSFIRRREQQIESQRRILT